MKSGTIEEEYRPLPSPPRSSLRSGRSLARPRDKGRVTFAQDYSSNTIKMDTKEPDIPMVQKLRAQSYKATQDNGKSKQSTVSVMDQETLLQEPVQVGKAWDNTSIPAHWSCTSPGLSLLRQPLAPETNRDVDLDSRTKRLLELTSDLYVATHQPDHVTPIQRFSESAHRQRPARRSVSVDRMLDHLTLRLQKASRSRGGSSPERQTMNQGSFASSSSSSDSAWRDSVSSVLHSVPPGLDLQTKSRYQTLSTQSSSLGSTDCPVPRTPSPQLGISELSSALKGLLDLVDQHWSGTRSLHLNPSFLGQAYDLLSAVISPASPAVSCTRERVELRDDKQVEEDKIEVNRDNPHSSELAHLKRKLAQTQQQLESLKKRLVTALKENYNLKLKSLKQYPSISVHSDQQWASCLQKQVKALSEQQSYLKQLELTMELLQDNHKSLVSNNKSILGQLNGWTTENAEESLEAQEVFQDSPST